MCCCLFVYLCIYEVVDLWSCVVVVFVCLLSCVVMTLRICGFAQLCRC